MLDLKHPFFNPLWRRIVVVVLCLGWAVVEVLGGSPGWAVVFAGIGLFAAYQFFVGWTPVAPKDDTKKG